MKISRGRLSLSLAVVGLASVFTGCAVVSPNGTTAVLLPPPPPIVIAPAPALVIGGPAYVYRRPFYRPYYGGGYGYRSYGYRGGYYRGGYNRGYGGYRGYAWR